MNVLIYGLGALGTVFATLLKSAGHSVSAVDTDELVSKIGDGALFVTGIWGEHRVILDEIAASPKDLKNIHFDLVIITVKSYYTEMAVRNLAHVLDDHTLLMLAQDGYGNYELARQFIAKEQLVAARLGFTAESQASGLSRVTLETDPLMIGSPDNSVSPERLQAIAQALSAAGIQTRASDEIMQYIWGNFIYNCALSSLGAVLEAKYGLLIKEDESKVIIEGIVYEVFQVLEAMGEKTLWPDARAFLEDFYLNMVRKTAENQSPMLQDILRGQPTEVEALNGAIVKLGKQYGIQTPANEMMRTMVHNKELMNGIKA